MIIPLVPIQKDATDEERLNAYRAYCLEIVNLFPSAFLPLGEVKRWYHFFRQEHPLTRFEPFLPQTSIDIPMPTCKLPKQ
jgi:hypothetical protein